MDRKGLRRALGYCGYTLLIAALLAISPVHAQAPDGPRGWISIPSLGLYKSIGFAPIVNRTYDLSGLKYGVAHLDGTAWVDDGWGRVVLAGHNPGGFTALGAVQVGDQIIIRSWQDTYVFVVGYVGLAGNDVHYLMPSDGWMLTLMTCWDKGSTWWVVNAYPVTEHMQ